MMKLSALQCVFASFVLAPLTLTAVAACGGDAASSGSGSASSRTPLESLTACSLLTAEEIEAATGRAAAEGKDMSQVGGRLPICTWPPADGESFDTLVNVLVSVNAYRNYAQFLESARASPVAGAFGEDAVEEVTGVGEFGVWIREAGMLQIYSGDRVVQITVPTDGGDPLAVARTLGTAALMRID